MKKWIYIILVLVTSACQDDNGAIKPDVNFSEFQDTRDGTIYKCINVGGDIWLAENLRYRIPGGFYSGCIRYSEGWGGILSTQFDKWLAASFQSGNMDIELYNECTALRNEGYLPGVLISMIGYKFPESLLNELMTYDKTSVDEYGYLYTYEALKQAVIPGWEIPTDEDWKRLEQNLGMTNGELNHMEAWRGNGQADLLLKGEQGIGFDIKPGGARVYYSDDRSGVYEGKGYKTILWTSDTLNGNEEGYLGIVRTFMQNEGRIWRGTTKRTGTAYFVRCIYRKK